MGVFSHLASQDSVSPFEENAPISAFSRLLCLLIIPSFLPGF